MRFSRKQSIQSLAAEPMASPSVMPANSSSTSRQSDDGHAGRPSIASRLTDSDILAIRRFALTAPRWQDVVSLSLAVRLYAQTVEAPEWFKAWAASRSSKCQLPRSLIEALGFTRCNGGYGGRLIAHDQAPGRERLRFDAYSPGSLRLVVDAITGELRLSHPGEAETWDDATVNGIYYVGGEIARIAAERGDPCAQRYGVVVGRWQLLLGVDVNSDYIPGWQWVIRERASYQQTDPIAAFAAVWAGQNGAPLRLITERGTWESARVQEVLSIWGIEQTRSYHPRTKLVESCFNRLWTRLGSMPASVGRGRGENEIGDKLLRQCRAGSIDPREHCLSLEAMDARLRAAAHAHNSERIESQHYGKWIPAERWAEAASVRRPLNLCGPEGWAARPERRLLKVRRGGMVACEVNTGWGWSEQFAWGGEELWKYVGREVAVYFDPAEDGGPATIVDPASRVVLERNAISLTGDALAGVRVRAAQAAAVRREARVLRPDGTLAAWKSEIRTSTGAVQVSGVQRTEAVPASVAVAPSPSPRGVPAEAPQAVRRGQAPVTVDGQRVSPARPSSTEPRYLLSRRDDELDPDEIERLEAEARRKGLLSST